MITMPLHVQFTLLQFAMSTTDVGSTGFFPSENTADNHGFRLSGTARLFL